MSYGFVVKVSDDVPLDLVNTFNIPTSPVIHRGNIGEQDVAKHFVESIVEVSRKIEQLLKTNVPITMSYMTMTRVDIILTHTVISVNRVSIQ